MTVSIATKRLHDADMNGWYSVFVYLVPLIALIVIGAVPGTPGANRFGPDPLTGPVSPGRWIWTKSVQLSANRKIKSEAETTPSQSLLDDGRQSHSLTEETGKTARWHALIRFDDEIRAAAEKLRPFGDTWVNQMGQAYLALDEDRR